MQLMHGVKLKSILSTLIEHIICVEFPLETYYLKGLHELLAEQLPVCIQDSHKFTLLIQVFHTFLLENKT